MNNVIWLSTNKESPARGYWDQNLFEIAFEDYIHTYQVGDEKEAIVIIPGAKQDIDKINIEINKLEKCVVIITSDEENKFEMSKLHHSNMIVYMTYPNRDDVKWLPIWYPPHANAIPINDKSIDWLFLGQINHNKRIEMRNEIMTIPGGMFYDTKGFARGLTPERYIEFMSRSKVVLCPRGNVSYDSFRLYEALECGCIPIVENYSFWRRMFSDFPLFAVDIPEQWKLFIIQEIRDYEVRTKEVQSWWKGKKQNIINELRSL